MRAAPLSALIAVTAFAALAALSPALERDACA